jgi:hypothetical protein
MCPACLTTVALVTAAVTSTGGIAALAASRLGRTNHRNQGARHTRTPGRLSGRQSSTAAWFCKGRRTATRREPPADDRRIV